MPPRVSALLLLLLLGGPGCGCGAGAEGTAGPGAPAPGQAFEEAPSRKGTFRVGWRTFGGTAVPRNEHFSIEVRVARAADGAAVEGAVVNVRCDMPDHGHGMNVVPEVTEVGGGLYRAEGLLLHMRGSWVLGVDVIVDDVAESADFPVELP